MNQLIIGGLLGIGVLALIALVLVARSEQHAQQADPSRSHKAAQQENGAAATNEPASYAATTVVMPEQSTQQEERGLVPIAPGQFHEVSDQLRSLHRQAQEFEYQLGVLTNMIERMERSANGHTHIKEEQSSASEKPSAHP